MWPRGHVKRDGPLAVAAIVAAAAVIAYHNSFHAPFVFDDVGSIPENPTIRHLADAWLPPKGGETVTGRPVLNVSFVLNFG